MRRLPWRTGRRQPNTVRTGACWPAGLVYRRAIAQFSLRRARQRRRRRSRRADARRCGCTEVRCRRRRRFGIQCLPTASMTLVVAAPNFPVHSPRSSGVAAAATRPPLRPSAAARPPSGTSGVPLHPRCRCRFCCIWGLSTQSLPLRRWPRVLSQKLNQRIRRLRRRLLLQGMSTVKRPSTHMQSLLTPSGQHVVEPADHAVGSP